jgi:acetylglutamate kinase
MKSLAHLVTLLAWCALQLSAHCCSAFQVSSPHRRSLRSTTAVVRAAADEDGGSAFADAAITVSAAVKALKGQTIVVKYGGNAMTSEDLKAKFCQDVAVLQSLGIRVVVVHGGGPQINAMLDKVGVESRFEGGMRVSSPEVVEVAEMVLCGSVNKEISSKICGSGGRAVGLSGRDASLLQCTKQPNKDGFDLGYVGKVETVNTEFLNELLDAGICPVISPIGTGIGDEANVAYNINADAAAGRIAGELLASRVLFLTDISGVLDKEKKLLSALTMEQVDALIADETITGGMIPKVSYATSAVQLGVKGAFITDGRVPHALIREVLGGGASGLGSGGGGTIITV